MASVGNRYRILIIVQNLPVPFDRRVWLEATTLANAGYQVSVICPKGKGFRASFEQLEDVDIYRYALPFNADSVFGYFMEITWCFLRTLLLSFRVMAFGRGFDIIQACNPPDTYWLLAAFWRPLGKRFVFDHHDLSPEMYAAKFGRSDGFLYRCLVILERLTFKVADTVISTNASYKAIAMSRGGIREEDVIVVRSGPDTTRFRRWQPEPGWKAGKPHLLVYLGEICAQDGVEGLVDTVKSLRDDYHRTDFHCVIVGGGPHQPAVKAYAEEIGVGDLCDFTGFVSNEVLCRILSSADVAIDPDPMNPWSDMSTMNKVMDYMFFGLPIVAYDLTETRVSAGEAAIYISEDTAQALAGGIVTLLEDPVRRRAMSEFGERRLHEELTWEHSAPALLSAYDSLFRRMDVTSPLRSTTG